MYATSEWRAVRRDSIASITSGANGNGAGTAGAPPCSDSVRPSNTGTSDSEHRHVDRLRRRSCPPSRAAISVVDDEWRGRSRLDGIMGMQSADRRAGGDDRRHKRRALRLYASLASNRDREGPASGDNQRSTARASCMDCSAARTIASDRIASSMWLERSAPRRIASSTNCCSRSQSRWWSGSSRIE
jgi:hypothetical protein